MKFSLGKWCVFLFLLASVHAEEWSGKKSSFHSFNQYDFSVGELKCKVVVPENIADGKPWVWRARFFGHEPQTDVALLEKGFHIAYVDVAGLYGSPKAVGRWDAFYEYLTTAKGFAKKPALEGMSRGGLIIYNWASKNPETVACIYADAPVCDIKSWPGTGEKGKKMLSAYGFTPEQAEAFKGNPVDNLKPLAAANVPLLHVVGDADTVVPVVDNTALMESRYKALGGSIQVIHKEGIGHHPHSLKDPQPIVDFIVGHAAP
ncbi:MAG: prolyl oligopeptidase family serine peptidase [Kiritimatiellales bacterium]|nr:prolyl oligopeptidase family serine peptidase [Kiritimatiellales bacterium]